MSDKLEPLNQARGIDPAALRARYRAERDRRLRPEGLGQFVRIDRAHHHRYERDPADDTGPARAPLSDEVDIAIIGAGFGGLLLGAALRKAGLEGLRFIDRAGDFGGVWYWNRYPGAACDTEAPIYLPLLEELGVLPPRKYATGPEIFAHCQLIADRFDLHRDACFHTDVTDIAWDETAGFWTIRTDRGDAMRARFVVVSAGVMDRPKLADLPGLGDFGGHSFHTSRWDYAYTGGSPEGGLAGLTDKVVGIIGTGATAVQCIPHLGAAAKHLYVFQRTPSSIDRRDDRALDPGEFEGLEAGWQQKRMENFTALVGGALLEEDLVGDGWTSIPRNMRSLLVQARDLGLEIANPYEVAPLADLLKMEEIRQRVEKVVGDPATAEALKPWYDRFCKRPCFHDGYLPTFNRPNVTLVDTRGEGVERITARGPVANGREFPVDCLIYSTGYDASSPFAKRISFAIAGRGGLTLKDKWANGAQTFHGYATHGFPNLFIMSHVQTGLSLNFPHMIGEQARHIAHILAQARERGAARIEASRAAEEAWVAEIDRAAVPVVEALRECTPSYFNHEGDVSRLNARNSAYGGGPLAFYEIIAAWRAAGGLAGLELTQ
ncbi:NAD(P)/FAD-dependent oxidoreductase [Novosphingobium sp. G106]|uniref:flavin-containing monooxygenase n=1 Tax=Novosphingobium sp. G106 TaxID=2849500 RepID=UPI001C2D622D|nr:NAD(P)/FAD-dependent oxidoreductase [Novosphingobium sp. G106]MBV1687849.1 NAD(P)/FAD-dependent oxidoreductase [Novosphingobium sp. G106]